MFTMEIGKNLGKYLPVNMYTTDIPNHQPTEQIACYAVDKCACTILMYLGQWYCAQLDSEAPGV